MPSDERRPASHAAQVALLSPRQRQCLGFVPELTSKSIAERTGLSRKTVDTYIGEAVATLSARDRRHAAQILRSVAAEQAPDKFPSDLAGVAARAADPLPALDVERGRLLPDLLPFRRKGAPGNDLHIASRLLWIALLAIGFAVGFGMLAVGGQVVSDLVAGLGR